MLFMKYIICKIFVVEINIFKNAYLFSFSFSIGY